MGQTKNQTSWVRFPSDFSGKYADIILHQYDTLISLMYYRPDTTCKHELKLILLCVVTAIVYCPLELFWGL